MEMEFQEFDIDRDADVAYREFRKEMAKIYEDRVFGIVGRVAPRKSFFISIKITRTMNS